MAVDGWEMTREDIIVCMKARLGLYQCLWIHGVALVHEGRRHVLHKGLYSYQTPLRRCWGLREEKKKGLGVVGNGALAPWMLGGFTMFFFTHLTNKMTSLGNATSLTLYEDGVFQKLFKGLWFKDILVPGTHIHRLPIIPPSHIT